MNKIISLTRTIYKNGKNDSGKLKFSTKVFFYMILALYLLFVFSSFWEMFITPLNILGEAKSFIPLIITIGVVFIFGTSVSYVANILYFSEDIETILSFPFKPKEIFTSKLLTVYIYELMIVAMLVLPGFIAYGYLLNEGVIFYIYSFFILLMLPVVPIILIAGIYTIIMQFLKFTKYKNLFKILTTVILLVMVMGFQLKMNLNMEANGEYNGEYILEMCDNFSDRLPYYLDVAVNVYETEDMLGSIVSVIWFIIINSVIFFVVVQLCNNLYIKGIKYNLNGTSERKAGEKTNSYKNKNKYLMIFEKDMKGLFRNTTFLIQCVIPVFFMPIIIIVMSVNSQNGIEDAMLFDSDVLKFSSGVLIIQFFMIMNYISVTAISREGIEEATFIKTLPLDFSKIVSVKTLPGIFFGVLNLVLAILYVNMILEFSIYENIILFIVGFLFNIVQNYLQVIIDLKHPKLYWEAEMAVVKQNINIFYAVLVGIGCIIIFSILSGVFANYEVKYFEVAVIALLLILYCGIKFYTNKNAKRLYENNVK